MTEGVYRAYICEEKKIEYRNEIVGRNDDGEGGVERI